MRDSHLLARFRKAFQLRHPVRRNHTLAARARAEALIEALPGSTFGKKTQARESLSRKDQENMIARSNRAFQTGTGPDPYPSPAPPRAAEGVSGWRS